MTTDSTHYDRVSSAVRQDWRELPVAFLAKDPAAKSRWEILLLYPGVKAVVMHRIAHALWQAEWWFCARAVSEFARFLTGIEIHPAATIGRRLVIDHGMGVVIGETAVIEDDVLIYQGVTLGGRTLSKMRRHPTVKSGVTIGAGASVLGAITIGARAQIGGGALVLKDVSPDAVAIGVPAVEVSGGASSQRE